jgi:hypothetical protein
MGELVIGSRFRGPATSGNGGYTCGVVAAAVGGGEVEVSLRLPPPLDTPLHVDGDGRVWWGEALVAEARPGEVTLDPPVPVEEAAAVAACAPDPDSPFPQCFVCGRDRAPGDGLRIFPGPVGLGLVAAPWTPRADTVGREFVWSALDCPGAYATGMLGRGIVVLGRLTARVERVPQAGERCVAVGWSLGSDGRKHGAGTALFTADGELLGLARALWIEPRPALLAQPG